MEANSIEHTLRNIEVIGSLAQNDKLITSEGRFLVYEPTAMRGLLRMLYYRENREGNVAHIQSTIKDAKQFIEMTFVRTENFSRAEEGSFSVRLQHETQQQTCRRIHEALMRSVQGLEALKLTYRDDASIKAKLVMLINEVRDFDTCTKRSGFVTHNHAAGEGACDGDAPGSESRAYSLQPRTTPSRIAGPDSGLLETTEPQEGDGAEREHE